MSRSHLLAALTLAFVPWASRAEVFWICTLGADAVHLVCVADADPLHKTAEAAPPRASVRGTTFPLDPARSYVVDLWSPPTEWERVQELAQATLCWRTPDCRALAVMPGRPR